MKSYIALLFLYSFVQTTLLSSELKTCSCDPQSDSLELVNLYQNSGGEDWTFFGNGFADYDPVTQSTSFNSYVPNEENMWDFSQPFSSWYGVKTNASGCVEELILDNCNLTGVFPDLQLPDLVELHLESNKLTGSIPDLTGVLNLEYLNCGANELSGTIKDFTNTPQLIYYRCFQNALTGNIPDFVHLPDLIFFDCSGNMLAGNIPDFSNLPNLSGFECSLNQLTGDIPDFSNLPNLTLLECSRNLLTGSIPDFSNLPNLWALECTQNQLTGNIPDFSNLPNLSSFGCSQNQLTGGIPDFLNLTNLSSFGCYQNQLTGSIPDFSNLPKLADFSCASNQLSGSIPDFSNLPNLWILDCSTNQLTGSIPDFSNLSQLSWFFCLDNRLTGSIPDFSNLPYLSEVYIFKNELSGTVPDFTDNCPYLNILDIRFNQFTFEDILPYFDETIILAGYYEYEEQDTIFHPASYAALEGESLTIDLEIDEGIEDNIYSWYKNGVFWDNIIGNNDLEFSNISLSDAGTYEAVVFNPNCNMVLYSHQIEVVVDTWEVCESGPSGIGHDMLTNTSVRITWDPVPGATNYQVRYRKKTIDNSDPWTTVGTGGPNSVKTISGLDDFRIYEYRVRAYCNDAWGNYSELYRFYASTCDYPDLSSFQFTYPQPGKVRIEWALVDDATKYQIRYREQTGGSWSTVGTTPGNNFKTISGLNAGTTYEFRIRSYCSSFWSQYSYLPDTPTFTTPRSWARINKTGLLEGIKVFPNPVSDVLYIELPIRETSTFYQVFDVFGRILEQGEIQQRANSFVLATTKWQEGTYFIRFEEKGKETIIQKIVK